MSIDEAIALHRRGKLKDAERAYRALLRRTPENAAIWFLLGTANSQRERYADAVDNFRRSVKLDPSRAEAHINLGAALKELGDPAAAIESYRASIRINPNVAQAHYNLGIALMETNRPEEAVDAFRHACSLDPADAEASSNLGVALAACGRHRDAIESYRRAIALDQHFADAHFNLGNSYAQARRPKDAVDSYRKALRIDPESLAAQANLCVALLEAGQTSDAAAAASRALELDPANSRALSVLAMSELTECNWSAFERTSQRINRHIERGGRIEPFVGLSVGLSPARQLEVSRRHAAQSFAGVVRFGDWPQASSPSQRFRIGYISGDLREHPVPRSIVEILELHNRELFEIAAISIGGSDGSGLRQRIERAVERFVDLEALPDHAIAQRIRELGIQVAVDLGGYTRHARPAILAARPAPVQVSYLGYAGTMGGDFIDYIVADPVALPPEQQNFYSEHAALLDRSFFPNDRMRQSNGMTPSREAAGLPEHGFVFCSFGQSLKLSAPIFAIWMSLLRSIEGSVLWLSQTNSAAAANLRSCAESLGVSAERLVFAERTPTDAQHLARHRLADLFLDTHPYGAHATACDALWAGLPLLTCADGGFPGRVAASLLHAGGMSELVAPDFAGYEALALELARDPGRLAQLRHRLHSEECRARMFDTGELCRSLEMVYRIVWNRRQRDEPPRPFTVGHPEAENGPCPGGTD